MLVKVSVHVYPFYIYALVYNGLSSLFQQFQELFES